MTLKTETNDKKNKNKDFRIIVNPLHYNENNKGNNSLL